MAKYLLLKHYRGAPASVNDVPMDRWTPAEVEAHVKYMDDFAARLRENGEFVDSNALTPEGAWVRSGGTGKPPVTDGPFAETKDLIAGFMIIDVDTYDRALDLAGELSAAPGAGGDPVGEWHPSLSPASAVALTLRAVGGLTTKQIAQAYLVPESTMAQRISRAKRTVSQVRLDQPGDLSTVLRVLYLVFNEGYSGDVDLAAEAIRLARQLAAASDDPEAWGLLALFLLHHARRDARTRPDGALVSLVDQDRGLWRKDMIAEGVSILQAALSRDRLGEYQAQAAIAALHADARTAAETDWVQIVEWYDELVRLTGSPIARLNRAVAVGEADGPRAGLAELDRLDPALPRYAAVSAHLHERSGDLAAAARLFAEAAGKADSVAERNHLALRAAQVRERLAGGT